MPNINSELYGFNMPLAINAQTLFLYTDENIKILDCGKLDMPF